MRALIISANGYEESELLVPYYRLLEEGLQVDIAAPRRGAVIGKHGYRVRANLSLREAEPERYELLVVPGGKAPQALSAHAAALSVVKRFFDSGKPVAAICHGPLLLAAAGVLKARTVTAHESVAHDLEKTGARYEDSEVVVDGNLVTSRGPADLPAFMRAALTLLRAREAGEFAAAAV
ncbi:MAG: type 1 glutamine amidotransferase [Betaproteobacteria bacterium]|nr:MAG: type 1 glutamine amidotransferase [Betaproteobacteria bacterium]